MKHLERHPKPVAGCFGCKVMGLQWRVPEYMRSRNDDAVEEVRRDTLASVASDPDRYVPQGHKWL